MQAQKSVLLLAELPGGQQHAVCCALCLLFHDGAGKEQLEEESTWMTKVGSEGDSASPLTGVQTEGGFAPTGPSMKNLGNSCLNSVPV